MHTIDIKMKADMFIEINLNNKRGVTWLPRIEVTPPTARVEFDWDDQGNLYIKTDTPNTKIEING